MKEAARTLGQNIAFYRSRKGISQMKLAELVDVSPNSIKNWEGGKTIVAADKVCILCEALGITPNRLFQWEEPEEESDEKDELLELMTGMEKLPSELKAAFMMQIKGMNQALNSFLASQQFPSG